jgi:hypothetical protein
VGTVARAERIVDVHVDAFDQLGDEGRVVALLTRVEAQVLQQLDTRCELGQASAHGVHRVLRVRLALGAAEVRGRHDRAPRSVSQLIVGRAARMRKSSVITPFSIGTLKSYRTSTRLPRRRRGLRGWECGQP